MRAIHQRQERGLDRGYGRWESKVDSLGIVATLAEAVLEHAIDDSANTKGGLDDVRDKLLLLLGFRLSGKANHFTCQCEIFAL